MTNAQVVETSATINNKSPIQDYIHLDDHTQPTYEMTPGFKPFTTTNIFLGENERDSLYIYYNKFATKVATGTTTIITIITICYIKNLCIYKIC